MLHRWDLENEARHTQHITIFALTGSYHKYETAWRTVQWELTRKLLLQPKQIVELFCGHFYTCKDSSLWGWELVGPVFQNFTFLITN